MEIALDNIVAMYVIMLAACGLQALAPYPVKAVNDLVFNFFLPATIFYSISRMPSIDPGGFVRMAGACILVITAAAALGRFAAGRLRLSGGSEKTFALGSAFGNYGFLGLPITHAVFGDTGLVFSVYFLVGSYIFLYAIGFFLMTGKINLSGMVRNPLVISTAAGFAFLASGFELPSAPAHTMSLMNGATFPLSMVVVGGGLNLRFLAGFRDIRNTLIAVFIKLFIPPGIAFLAASALSLDPVQTGVCVLQAGMPAGVLVTVFSVKYGGDESLSNAIVSLATLGSIATVPLLCTLLQ